MSNLFDIVDLSTLIGLRLPYPFFIETLGEDVIIKNAYCRRKTTILLFIP